MTRSKFQLVGSLLRPKNLLEYKEQIEARDDITYPFYDDFAGYQEVETNAIKEVVKEQIEHGIDIVTDGEFSKALWHLDFLWGLDGVERFITDHGYAFKDHDGTHFETRKDIGIRITAPLSGKNHHFLKIFKEVKEDAGNTQAKLTVWGAAHAFTELTVFNGLYGNGQVYKTQDDLKKGLIKAYKEFLTEFKEIGGEIVQFDDCLWTLFSSDNQDSFFAEGNESLEDLADTFIAINNEVADFGHSLGLKVWTHNCRGNYQSRHAAGGSYQTIAKKFLGEQHYDRFFLEWDDERAGDISALEVLKNKPHVEVVLGLLSSKTATLDDETRIYQLLEKASQILPKERLLLSHQCGFASCDCGNELTQAQQWAKIDQGQKIAKNFWTDDYVNQYN
ncbi:5-methyltetrahydropteroyltriglutamate--homocysteine methyltransferase [Vagococcus martis]|uniref:5-methyltetrahydropteroyltriglutamate--homocysteine methyltransferase n=1 Tax=Vagococcus martis TaxID=1768210 RepID=A0A1V4DHF0_9ENTE|nr:cobalamin-independent methionine synthase II family protein [Vagococcus martis]OPF87650.1 5-methyltetrahydropteroyltriglutamate--homocysteine methyltransferase [Vagococcus martis]